ncbi:hypothetical protein AWC38_SpisGene8125 [Stylophora pistillata]|uniref:RING-type domain-containing protein n=1 Tax=Stylophora pistillata TaxID=50429 RepID=A0A2B4SFD2_STYPI|nr:hypothetical protein AWC38_SpisGene8125 [Stylophora pistillata]
MYKNVYRVMVYLNYDDGGGFLGSQPQREGNLDDDSDSDVEGLSMSAVPLEHILQGSYKDRSVSEFYDAGSNLELLAVPPVDLIGESSTGTSAATVSSNYELLVTVEMSRWDEQGPQQLSDIKLFVVESEDTTEAQTSASRQSVSSVISQSSTSSSPTEAANFSATSSDLHNAVCVVCRELPVTRAFLPCRHACICGLCSRHLREGRKLEDLEKKSLSKDKNKQQI